MLTRKKIEQIRSHGLTTLHDYWFNSLFAGEPVFEDGVLGYYDGRRLTLCGFPLRDSAALTDTALRCMAQRWAEERGAEVILVVGPRPLDLRCLKCLGFRRVHQDHRPTISAEMLIDCTDWDNSHTHRRLYRRARAAGFQTNVRSGGIALAEHLKLIEQFYQLRQMTPYLADVAFTIPALLRSRRVHLVEARKEGDLCGFVMMHRAFVDIVVGLFLFHDHSKAGVSDFLYAEMINHTQRMGATYINVGASPTPGHYDFKSKWGAKPLVPPYYSVEWARGHIARRLHISWAPRLIRL